MKNLKFFLFGFCLLTFTSCIKENLIEENPPISVVDVDENDFFMIGTLGGEPFEIRHLHLNEKNQIFNSRWNGPMQSYYSSQFDKNATDISDKTLIRMAITESGDQSLEDILSVGEIPWYPRDNDVIFQNGQIIWNPSIAEVYFPIMRIDGKNHADAMNFDYNKFEITGYKSLTSKTYQVEGNFQIRLIGPSGNEIDLVIDSFRAIFADH